MTTTINQKIDEYFSHYPKRSYAKGEILVLAGESPQHIFYITKGRVRQYDMSYKGTEIIVNIFKPPAFFPISWALNRTENTHSYKTDEAVELHLVPIDDALDFLKANPDVVLDLLSRVYRGMDGLLGRMSHLMSGTARSRLMYELIIECRRFGQEKPSNSYALHVSEVDLAARSGLSRETVNREIQKLKTKKLVSVTSGGIKIHDLTALERQLGAEV